jgi:hypothetical protein
MAELQDAKSSLKQSQEAELPPAESESVQEVEHQPPSVPAWVVGGVGLVGVVGVVWLFKKKNKPVVARPPPIKEKDPFHMD